MMKGFEKIFFPTTPVQLGLVRPIQEGFVSLQGLPLVIQLPLEHTFNVPLPQIVIII